MPKSAFVFIIVAALALPTLAQHEGHQPHKPATEKGKPPRKPRPAPAPPDTGQHTQHQPLPDTARHQPGQHAGHGNNAHSSMTHAFSRSLPMTRNGSGTGWLPDQSPMYGHMYHTRNWMFMLHYNLFLRYNKQDVFRKGERGDGQFDAPNWLMFMGQRPVGRNGLFRFSTMISLDPLTVGGNGYPLLFQTGETYQGTPLIDRQHPHDLFSELSVGYTQMLSPHTDVFVYLAYPGEPALSNVAFMHRPSALNNPDSPLGHHWQDATHITFGVATIGLRHKNWKLEGSSFTGREPGENRYNFDKPRFDSRSTRLTFNPSENWSLQASHAYVKSPEAHEPDENVYRSTVSAIYNKKLNKPGKYWTNTANWGYNYVDAHHKEHSVLLESTLQDLRLALYGRYEWVEKSAAELGFPEERFGHDAVFGIHALTIGANRRLAAYKQVHLHLGAQLSAFRAPERLHSTYGSLPVSAQVYLRIFPGLMLPD